MKKEVITAVNPPSAGPVLLSRDSACNTPACPQTCELCQRVAASREDLQFHLRTEHTSFVDRLIISMCLAAAS